MDGEQSIAVLEALLAGKGEHLLRTAILLAVHVFISTGPASTTPLHFTKVTMPSVVGDSVAQAERELAQAGIRSIAFKYFVVTPGKTVRTGTVVAQSPAAGTAMPSGKAPTLWIRP